MLVLHFLLFHLVRDTSPLEGTTCVQGRISYRKLLWKQGRRHILSYVSCVSLNLIESTRLNITLPLGFSSFCILLEMPSPHLNSI